MKTMIRFCILLCAISGWVFAQPVNNYVKDIVMPAPNAASLGKYGDIPVSYYTGVPDISIPIYTVQEGPLSLPVGLSYHAGGVRLAENASWVGLGWSLNAGGMVSRVVQGLRDDDFTRGYYFNGQQVANVMTDGNVAQAIREGNLDGEADIFSFNFAGYSGKFYFDMNQQPNLIPQQDIKIQVTMNGGEFYAFTLIVPDGTKYIFGGIPGGPTATERSVSTGEAFNLSALTSWYLLRVESSDGNYQINLSYVTDNYSYKNLASSKFLMVQDPCGWSSSIVTSQVGDPDDPTHPLTRTEIIGKRLSSITSSTGTINFVCNTDREDLDSNMPNTGFVVDKKRLDQITINSGSFCTQFLFSYAYFFDYGKDQSLPGPPKPEYKRLKLTSLQEKDCSNAVVKPPHLFSYIGDLNPDGTQFIRFRLSKATDSWGFDNGAVGNEGLEVNVPNSTVIDPYGSPVNYGSANRGSNFQYMKNGALNKIDYPTGGYTSFEYEANTYADIDKVYSNLLNLENYAYPSNVCCGEITTSNTFTFSSASQISQSEITLSLRNLYDYYPQTCDEQAGISLFIVNNSTNQIVGQWGYNVSDAGLDISATRPVTDFAPLLQPNVTYRFELMGTHGWARMQMRSYVTQTVNKTAGGLRIKEIKTHDGISAVNDIIKTYSYDRETTPGISSGVLLTKLVYGVSAFGYYELVNGGGIVATGIIVFAADNIAPMSSFEGHLGYQNVKESLSGNGHKTYSFNINTGAIEDPINTVSPWVPRAFDALNGSAIGNTARSESNNVVSTISTSYTTTLSLLSPGDMFRVQSYQKPCGNAPGGDMYDIYYERPYKPRTHARLVQAETSYQDGVYSTSTYTYDPQNRHLAPIAIENTNSDGKIYRTEHSYAHDLPASDLRTSLLNLNIIASPLETRKLVNNLLVDGSKIEYGFFNGSTGVPVSSGGTGIFPYPYRFHRYEMTWVNDVPTPFNASNWILKGTIDEYHPTSSAGKGYPKKFTLANWPQETYEWQNGLIKKRTYETYEWTYNYHTGTRLVSSITQPDGQVANFTYDALQRLSEVSARGGLVKTLYTYRYKGGSQPYNWVKDSTVYNNGIAVEGSNLVRRVNIQYLDGLGRPLQGVAKGQSPTGKDVISAVAYDNLGRQTHAYNPFESTLSTGAFQSIPANTPFSLTQYESSPLSRVIMVTPPEWNPTETIYSTNTSADAVLVGGGPGLYPNGSLYKTTVRNILDTDKSITFTDKQGRVVLSRRANSAETQKADTYSLYDDKGRLSKVLPPGVTLSDANLLFTYTYDAADRMTAKKVPDAAQVNMWYTTRDQLALVRDGNLAAQNKYLATRYDNFGRVVETGFWTGTPPATITPTTLTITSANSLTYTTYGTTGIEKGKVKETESLILDGGIITLMTTFSYDAYGRVISSTGYNPL
ncbi:MAG: RHS repeat protein, partial [Bacteroidetes bacterium]